MRKPIDMNANASDAQKRVLLTFGYTGDSSTLTRRTAAQLIARLNVQKPIERISKGDAKQAVKPVQQVEKPEATQTIVQIHKRETKHKVERTTEPGPPQPVKPSTPTTPETTRGTTRQKPINYCSCRGITPDCPRCSGGGNYQGRASVGPARVQGRDTIGI